MSSIQGLSKISSRVSGFAPRCSNPNCQKNTFRLVAWRQENVFIGEQWHCSQECLEAGAREHIAALLGSRGKNQPARAARMPLGLLLISRESITSAQLKHALTEQSEHGGNIGEIVQRLGFATEEQVTSAVAAQWGCPTFNMNGYRLPPNIHIPRPLMDGYRILPLHCAEAQGRLLVGFVDAIHHQLLYAIENISSLSVTACFITPSSFAEALQAMTRTFRQNELVFERKISIPEMAAACRNYVAQSGAERIRFGICRDYLWARVFGSAQELDLLFRLPEN